MTEEISKKDKPPYLLGLLCFIPLIGAFVGISLLLYGIFKYKDKRLMGIGLFGILFTIFVYGSLFYSSMYGDIFSKSYERVAKMQLNGLTKSIEFYKLQNGVYPDSLSQLNLSDEGNSEEDPFLARKMDKSMKTVLHYKKEDSVYTIFSVGIDGLPNTPDDIYPDFTDSTVKKLGLRKLAVK